MKTSTPLALLASLFTLLAVVAIVVIVLRAPSTADQLTLIGAIVAFMAPLITSVIALIRAESANGTAQATAKVVTAHLNNGTPPPAG